MKNKHDLSGIYFRFKNGSKWENWCFEDLPEPEQDVILEKKEREWLISMVKRLADTLHDLGDQFGINAEPFVDINEEL